MIIAIKIIQKDGVAVAKEPVKKIPVFGQILEMSGSVVFINTNNTKEAIEGLKPTLTALKNNKSLIIFPEGTRSFSNKLGHFKKGAFHIAMQAKVPIVPVIIENSYEIMPRGSYIINSGIVNIKVLNPIPTNDWNLENLNYKIDEVRKLYLKELNQN